MEWNNWEIVYSKQKQFCQFLYFKHLRNQTAKDETVLEGRWKPNSKVD